MVACQQLLLHALGNCRRERFYSLFAERSSEAAEIDTSVQPQAQKEAFLHRVCRGYRSAQRRGSRKKLIQRIGRRESDGLKWTAGKVRKADSSRAEALSE